MNKILNLVNFVWFEGFVLFTASTISHIGNRKLTLNIKLADNISKIQGLKEHKASSDQNHGAQFRRKDN